MPEAEDRSSPIGKSWRASFDAQNRLQAEAAMKADGTEWTWLENGDLRTVTKPMAALVRGEGEVEYFFN